VAGVEPACQYVSNQASHRSCCSGLTDHRTTLDRFDVSVVAAKPPNGVSGYGMNAYAAISICLLAINLWKAFILANLTMPVGVA